MFSAAAPAVAGARYRPDYGASAADWMAQWPKAGITRGVLVQPSFFGIDNAEMLAAIAAAPAKLRGVAVVNPTISADEIARLDAGGVRAIRWNLKGVTDYGHYEVWASLLDRLARLGWHLEVYVDHGRLSDIAPAIAASDVDVVFDHFGNPGADERSVESTFAAVERLARDRAVWCKLSAPYRIAGADPGAMAQRWIEAVGIERLVWGSDWPHTAYETSARYTALRAALAGWVGNEREAAVVWDNAARLYRFD